MLNFTFYNPTKIIFGKGTIKDIAKEIPRDAKIMITYGGGSILRNDVLSEVKAALAGYQMDEFGGIEPNPTYETLMKCVEKVQSTKSDFLLAVGRGVKQAMPFGTVLTLPATGSEMNNGAVITRRETKTKLPFAHRLVYPKFSVLDPTKTYTLPVNQIANGVVDTFVHITEQYITYPAAGKIQDRFAEGLLLTLIEDGPKALAEPLNYDVRSNLMWCATLGLNGLLSAGVPQDWATHMVGHELTALKGLDHAVTLAIVLPAMLTARKEEKKEKLLQYAERVWGLDEGNDDARMDQAIDMTRAFFERMGIKTRLCDYGITAEAIPVIVEQLRAHNMIKLGENSNVTPEMIEAILGLCV